MPAMMQRRTLLRLAGATTVGATTFQATAQVAAAWPNKPVRLIVPNVPGGALDIMARLLQSELQKTWPQQVIVEFKPGAGTVLGTDFVAKASPDGHTIGIVATAHVINPSIRAQMPYDTAKDLAHICMLARSSILLSASPNFAPSTLKEVVEYSRKNPGKVSYASAGAGSAMHFGGELLKQRMGLFMLHIPYRGSGGAYPDVIDGRVELLIDPLFASMPHVRNGKLKPIAVLSDKRDDTVPNIPAAGEFIPGFDVRSILGLVTSAGTPRDIVEKISTDVQRALRSDALKPRLATMGLEPIPSNPAHFDTYVREELKRWDTVAKAANIPKE
jgi:tripartite-type tricarboxylate transporter receptor subunit TctC